MDFFSYIIKIQKYMNKIDRKKRKNKLKENFINRYKISKSFEDYHNDKLNKIIENKIIEKALSDVDLSKINKLRIAKEYSVIISLYEKRIDILKKLCLDLDFNKITYKYSGYYEVTFSRPIFKLLDAILNDLNDEDDEIIQRINNDGYDEPQLDVEIDTDTLNKIDIINGLPNFIKGLGLGKKLYKKLIKDLDYISSFSGGDTNLNSSMVWKSISKDKDLFTFCNDDNIISFWNEFNYDKIIIKLREFYYKRGNNMVFDEDFMKKYKLNRENILNII